MGEIIPVILASQTKCNYNGSNGWKMEARKLGSRSGGPAVPQWAGTPGYKGLLEAEARKTRR